MEVYKSLNSINNNEFSCCSKPIVIENTLNFDICQNVANYIEKKSESTYVIEDETGNEREVFMKCITLVDYLKYFIGKYKNENIKILPNKEMIDNKELQNTKYLKYIHDKNNYSYVDGFFYYLSGF